MNIQKRNIAACIILSLVTCGIYSMYWFVCLTNETNALTEDTEEFNGGVALLLTLVTCGVFGWYWAYKMGLKVAKIKGDTEEYSWILFVALQVFGLGIVGYCLAQDAINKKVYVDIG